MAKNLVIVESPAKAKTIQKFLGNEYKVMSSFGHIRDLHKKDFSIDVENGFKPIYEVPEDKEDQVRKLKDEADKADLVYGSLPMKTAKEKPFHGTLQKPWPFLRRKPGESFFTKSPKTPYSKPWKSPAGLT